MLASADRSIEWKCSRCNPNGDDNEEGDNMRAARGCDKEQPLLHLPFAPEMRRCPKSQIPAEAWHHIANWRRWKALGWLPYGGTIHDQPLYVAEGIEAAQGAFDGYYAEKARNRLAELEAENG